MAAEDRIEPLFELDRRVAQLTALIFNIVRKKGRRAATVEDFNGRAPPALERRQSAIEIQARLMAAFGDRIRKA